MRGTKVVYLLASVMFVAISISVVPATRVQAGEATCNLYTDYDELDPWSFDDPHHHWGYVPSPEELEPGGEWRFKDAVNASGTRHVGMLSGYTLDSPEHIQEPWNCGEN